MSKPTIKSKYRGSNDGFVIWLEYETISKSFLGFNQKTWNKIPKPFYDAISERHWGNDRDLYVHGYPIDLDKFIEKWPNIEDYLKWYEIEQLKLKTSKDIEIQEMFNKQFKHIKMKLWQLQK